MADILPSNNSVGLSENYSETQSRFPFYSTDTMSPVSPISQNGLDRGVKPFCNGLSVPSSGSISTYTPHSVTGSCSSDSGSLNSVFYKSRCNGDSGHGNDYSHDPIKQCHSLRNNVGGGGGSNNGTAKHMRLHPTKNQLKTDSDGSGKKLAKNNQGNSQEVTYTITDEMENISNQVVILPPPPSYEPDSDNDSITGCDGVGPCSPRHLDWRDSRDFSKSPTSRNAPGNSRCLCCMLLIFILSTAGLSTVLVLMYMGMLEFTATPKSQPFVGQGRTRPGDEALIREVCETTECLKTSSSIMSRMNTTADPCEDFYSYACGGYAKEVDLSWFRTRIRAQPDDVIDEHKRFIIDRLSESFSPSDDSLMKSAKSIFRSCLFRSKGRETDRQGIVSEILDSLGGLRPSLTLTEPSDLTQLLANVTRMFGASPFFNVQVHSQREISITSEISDHINPGRSVRDFSRKRKSSDDSNMNTAKLKEEIVHLISGSVSVSEARAIVNVFFKVDESIRRILNTGRSRLGMHSRDMVECDDQQGAIGDLQEKHGGFGIDWFAFFENLLETSDLSSIKLCKVYLSSSLQRLVGITPKSTLRQYIMIYTLIHSDLRLLYADKAEESSSILLSENSNPKDIGETEEDHCLELVLHYMPTLEKFAGCEQTIVSESRSKTFSTIKAIKSVLYDVLAGSLEIEHDNAAKVTNSTTQPVMKAVSDELVSRCQSTRGPQGSFSEYNFTSNMLRLIQHYHGEYYQGRLRFASRDVEMSALWISSSILDDHRARSGPVMYASPIPQPILYGSLGSFLASRFADKLSIDALLNHHADGLLTHKTVLTLAVRLKCLVEMYSQMAILDLGSQVYKIDGELTKGLQWKDQLALKLSYEAWMRSESSTIESHHSIPGLQTFARPQLFFMAYTQTMCEKVSSRGILKYYVSGDAEPAIPSHQRVNGILRNSKEFSKAFKCKEATYMNPTDKCHII